MEDRKILISYKEWLLPLFVIIIAVLLRLAPHIPNFTPIAAMALFGGAYLDRKYAIIFPLGIMVISDLFLGFHQSIAFVYGSFILTAILGMYLRKRITPGRVVAASLLSSCLFFLITNFGFWLHDSLYPKTLSGQIQAYYYALPFFRNTLLGDLLYTSVFFGGYALVTKWLPTLRSSTRHV